MVALGHQRLLVLSNNTLAAASKNQFREWHSLYDTSEEKVRHKMTGSTNFAEVSRAQSQPANRTTTSEGSLGQQASHRNLLECELIRHALETR